ncbi:hypothetical protein ACX8XP_04580 [Calditrichota bacterium LG25]
MRHKILYYTFIYFLLMMSGAGRAAEEGQWLGVIYDNSGSMEKAGRHHITAYAFKLFTALLMPEDTLAIITMSEVNANPNARPRIFYTSRKRQILNYIDGLSYRSATPVETIRQMLRYFQQKDRTQKSLMILTDGVFEPEPNINLAQYLSPEENLIAGYLILNPNPNLLREIERQNVLPTLLEIINGSRDKGCFLVHHHREIPKMLGELFAFATGKSLKGQEAFVQVEGKRLRIKSPFPMRSVRLIYQSTDSRMVQISRVNFPSRKELYHQTLPGANLSAISGILFFNNVIPPDSTIEITFNHPLLRENLFLFLDTTLDLQLTVHNATLGPVVPIDQIYAVGAGDSLWLEGVFSFQKKPYQFSPSLLKRLKFQAQIRGGEKIDFQTTDRLLFKTPLFVLQPTSSGTVVIDVSAIFPGHFHLQRKLIFNTAPIHSRILINGQVWHDSLYTSIPRHKLDSSPPLNITVVTEKGDTVTRDFNVNISAHPEIKRLIKRKGNSITVMFDNYFFPWKDPEGNVKLQINAVPKSRLYTAHQMALQIKITPGSFWQRWKPFILTILFILFVIKCLYCLLWVPRFPPRARISYRRKSKAGYQNPITRKLHRRYSYLFCWRERRKLAGISFLANNRRSILIDRKFARGIEHIMVNGITLNEASKNGRNHIPVITNTEIEIYHSNGDTTIIQFRPNGKFSAG